MNRPKDPPTGTTQTPFEWSALGFHPVGLRNLRRNLMEPIQPSVFNRFRQCFEAAEVAWFSAGLALSPSNVGPEEFHHELHNLRNATAQGNGTADRKALRKKILGVTFDCAALLDRSFGSATLVIHVPGTTRPGSLHREDYVKANVYFPPHLLREDSRIPIAISDIVQRFIKDVGLLNIQRYEHCASLHWVLPPPESTIGPYSQQGILPKSVRPRSSVFEYHGRAPKVPVVVVDDDDAVDKEVLLREELEAVRKRIQDTQQFLKDARIREQEILAEIAHLGGDFPPTITRPATTHFGPRTPNRSRVPHTHSSQSSGPSGSTTASPSPYPGSSYSSPSSGPARSTAQGPLESSARASVINSPYEAFIKASKLLSKFSQIELIRTKVVIYLWRTELIRLGISELVVDDLMNLMSRQPTENE